jgi:hypothetical protein
MDESSEGQHGATVRRYAFKALRGLAFQVLSLLIIPRSAKYFVRHSATALFITYISIIPISFSSARSSLTAIRALSVVVRTTESIACASTSGRHR